MPEVLNRLQLALADRYRVNRELGQGGMAVVYPMMLAFKSNEEFHAFVVQDTKELNERTKENLKGTGATVKDTAVEPVPGVGDAAYYVEPSLLVLRKGRVLSITAADKDQAVTVAGKVVPRLQ